MPALNRNVLRLVLAIMCLILLHGCPSGTGVPQGNTEGNLMFYSGCKAAGAPEASTETFSASDRGKECLEYDYDGNNLLLKHINAAFNCCLDGITARIDVDGQVITITTEEKLANGQGCHCLCLYDLDYLITGLKPGIYTIVISSFSNLIQINFSRPTSGTYCETRDRYPWY